MVDAQSELIRSRVPLFCFGRQPATQALSPSTFINQSVFYPPLVQVVPPEVTNAQAKGVAETTSAEIKGVLEAMVKAIEHSGDPKSGQLGYSRDALMTIFTRAAKAMRTQVDELKKNRQDRAEASKREKQRWQKMADSLEGASKKEAADVISERTGAKFGTVYRSILKKRPK
jgi:ribosomal protein L9